MNFSENEMKQNQTKDFCYDKNLKHCWPTYWKRKESYGNLAIRKHSTFIKSKLYI